MAGAGCDMSGWVKSGGKTCSPPQPGHWSFWIDAQGRGHVGEVEQAAETRCAISGFRRSVAGRPGSFPVQ